MKYLLDTNAIIALLKGEQPFLAKLRTHLPEAFGLPAIVAHELFYGAYRSERITENLARIDGLRFEILDFDCEDAHMAGQLRAALAKAGTPIGPYDILIAGQAKARDLILITRNTREFERIDGLSVENW